jgi:shikimate dehydrogenase
VKFAVIGDPVAHSKSPALHAAFLREAGIAGTYEAIRVPAGACARAAEALRAQGYTGLNVTTPLKEEAFALCTELDETARRSGSVNTLTLRADAMLGANTDGVGALTTAQAALGASIAGKRVLLLGVGPTARAAAWTLHANGAHVSLWNRTRERALALAEDLGLTIWEADAPIDLAFSTLPPDARIPEELLRALRAAPIVIDANYGPRATLGKALGRAVVDGENMLAAQARASFLIWTRSGQKT